MKFVLLFILLFVFSVFSFSQNLENSYEVESIEVLKSKKGLVEKVLGKSGGKDCKECKYENSYARIIVNYSKAPCEGKLKGWNVSENVVLSYLVAPKAKTLLSSLNVNLKNFILTGSDTERKYHTNLDKGIQITSNGYEIYYIEYLPQKSDAILRCKGFPPYNPVSETYYPYDNYNKSAFKLGCSTVERIIVDLRNHLEGNKAYFVVYSGEDVSAKKFRTYISQLQKCVQKFNFEENVKIIEGIKRKSFEMDIFVLPKHYPAPTPKLE